MATSSFFAVGGTPPIDPNNFDALRAELAQKASEASSSADSASLSETNASVSAESASASAAAALSSASSATNSATAAATSATQALSSATAASSSETQAALSATQAATSETNAANSASSASVSANSAAASASSAATYAANTQPGTSVPVMDSVASTGVSAYFSREDHVHPTDTSRAPLASPAFTGTPTVPTAAVDTATTQAASTAFVVGQAASSVPSMNGTGAVGTSTRYARADHVHPTDTSKAPLNSPAFTGTPTAPTQASSDNTTALATTAFVKNQGYLSGTVGVSNGGTGATDVATARSNLSVYSQAEVNSRIGTTGSVGFRNRFINGALEVDQRNYGASATVPNSSAYITADRFYTNASTGAGTYSIQRIGATGSRRLRITAPASGSVVMLGQRIETVNSADLAGGTVSISLKAYASAARTVTWALSYANATDNFSGVTQIATGTWNLTTSEAPYITGAITLPSAAVTGLQFQISDTSTGGATLTTGEWQLEAGSTVTPFERRDYGEMIRRCQRYFTKTYAMADVPGKVSAAGGLTHVAYVAGLAYSTAGHWSFPVPMRVSPTVTLYSPVSGAIGKVASDNTDGNGAVQAVNERGATIGRNNDGTGIVANSFIRAHATADAEL